MIKIAFDNYVQHKLKDYHLKLLKEVLHLSLWLSSADFYSLSFCSV